MGQVCLNGPMMRLSGPRVVPNGPSVSKSYPKKKQEKPKSKLGLPSVTIRGHIILRPKSPRWVKKKVSSMSSNGPPRNYCGALKTNLKTCAKGEKLRVHTCISYTH